MSEDTEQSMLVRDLHGKVKKKDNEIKRLTELEAKYRAAAHFNEERIGVWRERYEKMVDILEKVIAEGAIKTRSKAYKDYHKIIKEVDDECEA